MPQIDENSLLVCSKSTRGFFPDHEKIFLVTDVPQRELLKLKNSQSKVVAVGGGAVIDTAKILSVEPILCYPTTASGSSNTSHAVWWDGPKKENSLCKIPREVVVVEDFLKSVPESTRFETTCDVISHCLDSLWSKKRTSESEKYAREALQLVEKNDYFLTVQAGLLGGKAIEITGTNLLHSLSYPLTGIYGISHGLALSFLVPIVSKYMNSSCPKIDYTNSFNQAVDWNRVIDEAFLYPKIQDTDRVISKGELKKLFC